MMHWVFALLQLSQDYIAGKAAQDYFVRCAEFMIMSQLANICPNTSNLNRGLISLGASTRVLYCEVD